MINDDNIVKRNIICAMIDEDNISLDLNTHTHTHLARFANGIQFFI